MCDNKIQSLEEYISRINQINDVEWNLGYPTIHVWTRGQCNAKWKLHPGLYRDPANPELERELNRDFQLTASQYLKS